MYESIGEPFVSGSLQLITTFVPSIEVDGAYGVDGFEAASTATSAE